MLLSCLAFVLRCAFGDKLGEMFAMNQQRQLPPLKPSWKGVNPFAVHFDEMEKPLDDRHRVLNRIKVDPCYMFTVLGYQPDPWQRQALLSQVPDAYKVMNEERTQSAVATYQRY